MTATETNIFQRSIHSGFWILFARVVNQVLSIVRWIILMRLLDPKYWGLLGMAMITFNFAQIFTNLGLQYGMIYKQSLDREMLDASWTLGIIRGIVLTGLVFWGAPLIAGLFGEPASLPVIQVISFLFLITAFRNIGTVFFVKDLQFHKRSVIEIGTNVIGFVVSVSLALKYRNVWPLIVGKISSETAFTLLSYYLHPFRPRLSFAFSKIRPLWGFGRHIMATSIMKYFILEGDDIVVANMVGTVALGLYRQAYRWSNLVAKEIGDVIGQVTFPAFSKLQDQDDRLFKGYQKTLFLTTFITYPVSGLLIILASDLVRIVLGETWMPMVPAMRVLCFLGAVKTTQLAGIFNAKGRPDINARFALIRLIIIGVSIFPLVKYMGIFGAAVSVTVSSICIRPLTVLLIKKMMNVRSYDIISPILIPFWATAGSALGVYILLNLFQEITLINLLVLMLAGVLLYLSLATAAGRMSRYYNWLFICKEIKSQLLS